jgi:hypothetical protein
MKRKRRRYLVARGASCVVCTAHGWRAYREPEERECMSPCTRTPIYAVWARNKRGAVALAKARFANEGTTERSMP